MYEHAFLKTRKNGQTMRMLWKCRRQGIREGGSFLTMEGKHIEQGWGGGAKKGVRERGENGENCQCEGPDHLFWMVRECLAPSVQVHIMELQGNRRSQKILGKKPRRKGIMGLFSWKENPWAGQILSRFIGDLTTRGNGWREGSGKRENGEENWGM